MIRLLPLALLASGCLPMADILPSDLENASDLEARGSSGRATLQAAAEASGYERWLRMDRATLTFRDEWVGMARLFNPWPDRDVRAQIVQQLRTFDSTARFLGGAKDGWSWGITDGHAYTVDPEGARTDVENADIEFMLPTVQYFMELPFRILEAEIVHSVGEQVIAGQTYDVVYATWGSVAANPEFDQYLLYVSQSTGRVEKVHYTVREMGSFVSGTCHLDDQRDVDGVWVPHRLTVNGAPDVPSDEGVMHTMYVEAIEFVDEDPPAIPTEAEPGEAE